MSAPNEEEIKKELERILNSDEFKGSARLSEFLRYIVKKTIDGEAAKITGYSIGVDIFAKSPDFNSDSDSSVRVEAVRLRRSLALYFHEEGKADPIIIKVPKGGYRPVFLNNKQSVAKVFPSEEKERSHKIIFILAIFIFSCLMSGVLILQQQETYTIPQLPVVAIGSFQFVEHISSQEEKNDLAYLLNQKLSRFSTLKNLVLDSSVEKNSKVYDYLLNGTVNQNNTDVSIEARLMDTHQNTVVWSLRKKIKIEDTGGEEWKEQVSTVIVASIASMHGIIDTLELKKYSHKAYYHNESYRCILEFKAYDNNKTPPKHKIARDCLEKLVNNFPDYSIAWAYLSWIYGDEVRYKLNPRIDGTLSKIRSLDAGVKAVEANQGDATAHMYLSSAAILNDRLALTKRHLQISIDLNPYDSDILASAAWKYGRLGEWELNRKFAEMAMELNPSPPKWYHEGLFRYYFYKGNNEKALFHALSNYQEDLFHSSIYLISAYVGAGRIKEARNLAEIISEKFPDKLDNYFKMPNTKPEWLDDKLKSYLRKAGLKNIEP